VTASIRREDVVRYRFHRHQLDRNAGTATSGTDVDVLDFGVQDTGGDGARWALEVRGAPPADDGDLAYAWTLRGAPHAYRRSDLAAIAVATAPYSEADAAKRIISANKALKAAGIPALDALRTVADHLRTIVTKPMPKGDMSAALTATLDEPFKRFCTVCDATHVYEMPFRLAALQAGLVLEPDTSPPVLHRVPHLRAAKFAHLAGDADERFDVIRNALRFFGPTRVADVAELLDAPRKEVDAHWPDDAVDVSVAGSGSGQRFVLADDVDALRSPPSAAGTVRLLGPYDPYVQLRDRELLVPGEAHRKALWPVLGRPGAIVVDGEVVGVWRPKAEGGKLTVRLDPWKRLTGKVRAAVDEQAERLAAHRGVALASVTAD
jgi:hypothetical protein